MRIEELILEGFKSYPVRTQITGWDSSFNAITGLNGSGKSNILDAICFVLGLTNMTQMRAQNQQDLIYKRGQAGITKASVTIVFDNSDPETSPAGLQDLPQITVTRQIALPNISKYLLNGHKSQQQTIQSLFQSVQLNINNPNFLIMQGRITKVLNMRPQEILGMVEEAAGTRMFEERKDKAKKTMGKKEKRVEEITSLLREEITPKLDTLRNEKRSFLQWQKTCSELERVARTLRAYEWSNWSANIHKKDDEIKANAKATKETKSGQKQLLKEAQQAERDAEGVKKQREKELQKGGKYQKLEAEVKELDKALEKILAKRDIRTTTISEEEKKLSNLDNERNELEASLADKRCEVDELTIKFTKVKEEQTTAQISLTNSEELLQTLLTGLAGSSNNTGGGYMGQLADARARITHAQTEESQARQKLDMAVKELKNLEGRWRDVEKEASAGTKKLEALKAEVEGLKMRLAATGWNKEKEQEKETEMKEAMAEVRELTEERDNVRQRLGALDFAYNDPVPNFNRSKVKGLVASLITLKPEDYNKSTALEITAGGKLYHLIVQDSVAGGQLIKNGGLKKRVTLIPLNQIRAFRMAAQKLQSAERVAPGKVHLALSLIGYPQEVSEAMAFVFGDTLICNDAATAKAVTFNPEIRARSVTLDGDVYDPSGTLSGGAPPTSNGLLVKAQQLQEVSHRLDEASATLQGIIHAEQRDRGKREQWKALVRDVDLKEHEARLLEEQLGGSNATRIGAQVEELKKTIRGHEASVQSARDKQKAASEDVKRLEQDMAEFKNNKEGKTEELKASISTQKSVLQKHTLTVKLQQKEMQTATLEREGIEKDIELADANIKGTQATIAKLREKLQESEGEVQACESQLVSKKKELEEERAALSRFDDELEELEQVIADRKKSESDLGLKLKALEHDAQGLEKDKTQLMNNVANLEKQYEWITEESYLFGKPGTQYDFAGVDVKSLRVKAEELEASNRGMKKKINPKVMAMIEGVEKREVQLKKMLDTVMKDKVKIEQTIEELDRYKRDALMKTWEKVNVDFGEIFRELLPSNFSKLQPPEGQDLMDGLEIKVQLGSVWKQSLTELSGGQRSLIALSLIMALLQFKPAPMYILDEIDAALDLSHTQHIGQLFRTRFKGSQFIVVSLKEGLFTNANVLFRTRFRDGTSIVERTAQRSTSSLYTGNQAESSGAGRRGGRS